MKRPKFYYLHREYLYWRHCKTPTSILIANELNKYGTKVAILRKYYKTHKDEYNLIKNYFQNLIISKKRINGLIEAEKNNYEVVILDDGLQDYSVKKDLKIVCFNKHQQFGNGLILPSGPLRENVQSLKDYNILILNGGEDKLLKKKC